MGRSVSYPSGAHVTFAPTPYDEGLCLGCWEPESECECVEDARDIQPGEVDWDWIADDLRDRARDLFPSLWDADDWLGREDRVLARNRLVSFGFSEYCGLMAIWLVPRGDLDGPGKEALAERWIESVWPKFQSTFGEFQKVGSMSNGEGVYRRIEA